ncbi:hypothetical protein XA68_15579 [Ophiocordyceps unilateralis]|uniref:Uncharacterized protein n=1 Tax=Ophiocordyceps unilateralis TaxID=268505 RepID=A0A2A9P858_OPHUN|nr:hypothetical protein XA68_15579 [Ophiocordyceps unilateralis]
METGRVMHRGAADENSDAEAMMARLEEGAWREWPNRAGFEGLVEHRGPIRLRVSVSVIYSSRRQSDEYVEHIRRVGWRSSTSFGQRADPCVGIFAKLMSLFVPRRMNTNVICLPNLPGLPSVGSCATEKTSPPPISSSSTTTTTTTTTKADDARQRTGTKSIFISTDHAYLQEISPDTMEPLGYTSQHALHPDLAGPLSCAHAQRDPVTGDWFNYNLALGRVATYRIFRVNAADGTTDVLATVSAPDLPAAYIHSFFLTENYVVLCIPGAHFAWNGLKILWERNIVDAIKPFDESRPCQWLVVDRRHGRGLLCRFTTPAAFFFHSVNAFEDMVKDESDGVAAVDLCLDAVFYDNTDVIFALYYDVLLNRDNAMGKFVDDGRYQKVRNRLTRYRFRMPTSTTTSTTTTTTTSTTTTTTTTDETNNNNNKQAELVFSIPNPHSGELSTINPGRAGRPYRFVYGISTRGVSTFMDSIVKTDVETRDALLWTGPWGHTPGEPVFVPRPGASAEDDGVVLSVVLDGAAKKSYLLCLDASTMHEMARAETDFAIAIGFHGFHAPALSGADGRVD